MFSSLARVLFFAPHIFHAPDLQSTVWIYPSTKNFRPPRTSSHVRYCLHFPLEWSHFHRYLARRCITLLIPIGYKVMNNADVLRYFFLLLFIFLCVLFQMPKMQFRSNAKPSLYAYPEPLKPPKKEEKEKV